MPIFLIPGRAYFNLHNRPAFLQIDPIRLMDAGDYRCRVDFKKARTVNTVISLKVIGKSTLRLVSRLVSQLKWTLTDFICFSNTDASQLYSIICLPEIHFFPHTT